MTLWKEVTLVRRYVAPRCFAYVQFIALGTLLAYHIIHHAGLTLHFELSGHLLNFYATLEIGFKFGAEACFVVQRPPAPKVS